MATGPFEAKRMSQMSVLFFVLFFSVLQHVILEPRKNIVFFSEAIMGVIINQSKISSATIAIPGL